MFEKLSAKLTKNFKEVPLFYVTFDLNKYKEMGKKGSCEAKLHPNLKDDEFIVEKIKTLIDHIRENYDMEDLSK